MKFENIMNTLTSLFNVNKSNINYLNSIAHPKLLFLNFYHIVTSGAAIFSDNIAEAKTSGFDGGSGVIRRLNWSLFYFTLLVNFFLFYCTKARLFKILFLLLMIVQILGGNKGAIVSVIILLSAIMVNYNLSNYKYLFIKKVRLYLPISIIFAVFVIFISVGNLEQAFSHFVTRLLYFGDVNIYLNDNTVLMHFSNWGPLDFIKYAFNSITGMFRITDYYKPIGTILVDIYNAGNISFKGNLGPNIPYFASGIIFFGIPGCFIFSIFIGFLLALIKFNCEYNSAKNMWSLLVASYLYFMTYTLIQDPLAFLGRITDSIVLITPVLFISIIFAKIIKRK